MEGRDATRIDGVESDSGVLARVRYETQEDRRRRWRLEGADRSGVCAV